MRIYKSFLLLMLAAAALPLSAQNVIHPKISGPNGLWVNSYNGVLFFGQTDMATQNSAMPMELRFYYNSSAYNTNYGYGLGFSLGYEMRYSIDDNGNVSIETGDGRTDTYQRFGTDFESPAGVFSVLTVTDDGAYILKEKDGVTYTFADTKYHKVTGISDRNGNSTELTYTDSLLTQIKDAAGHTITLNYTDGMLTSASSSFHSGTISYEYDANDCLRKRTDAMGNATLYAYTKDNRLEAITDANGHKTMIAYNQTGMCSRLKTEVSDKSIRYDGDKTVLIDYTEPQNLYSYYRWDSKGRVIEKVGLCCGIQSKLEYDDDDNVVKRTDANGGVITYTYDDRGNMLSKTDALGNTERYTYDEIFNQVTSFTDHNGGTYRFSYDAKGNLTTLSGPLGFSNTFTYNDKGWQLTATDANNNVTSNIYNDDGTTESVLDASGYTTRFEYDRYGNIISVYNALNNGTYYTYNANNQVVSQTDALGNVTTVSYDRTGNIVRFCNARNQITAYTYDALGNVLSMTNSAGGTYTYKYDGNGNVLSVTDPLGISVHQTWNERNKLLTQTNGAGETTSYDYDAKGNLIAVFQPNGNTLNYFYDKLDRITMISDNIGLIAKYAYDGNGNQLTVTDALDRTVSYAYDALNRRISETLPSGAVTRYTYDANGNLLAVTDALNHTTAYTYNSLNQQLTHTDALGAKTQFEYDGNGNLIRAVDAKGNATVYTYDALDRNTVISFANGATLQYNYDALDNVVSSRDRAGNSFKYTYDVLGNLLAKSYPDGSADRFTYDATGRMLTATNKDASAKFTYDRAGRMLSETLNGKTTSYSYDIAAGKRTMVYPSGMKIEEHLNARDMIASIMQNGSEVVTMNYDKSGQKVQQIYGNGITTDYAYNENGWLASIADDRNILSLAMTYDAIGNMTKREDRLNGERTESYGYDAISQLISFKRGTKVDKSYQFDLLGNRVSTIENGIATNYVSNNVNAYTAVSGAMSFTPKYDGNGNLLNDDKYEYSYDYNNKLKSVGTASYKYDALGRRISKTVSDVTTSYYYVGDQMVEELTGGMLVSYVYGNNIDEALAMTKNDNTYYYHTNHLGSVMALSDNSGKLVERVDYDAYGQPAFFDATDNELTASSIGNTILFTGREFDYETGNYYYRARTMHPSIGRFMQKDPILYNAGLNDLIYVYNSPIVYQDVNGEFPILVPIINGLVGGAIAGGIAWSTGARGRQLAAAATGGFVAGAIAGVATPLIVLLGLEGIAAMGMATGLGAIGGFLGYGAETGIKGDCFNWGEAGLSALLGGAFNGLFTGLSSVKGAFRPSSNSIDKSVANHLHDIYGRPYDKPKYWLDKAFTKNGTASKVYDNALNQYNEHLGRTLEYNVVTNGLGSYGSATIYNANVNTK